MSVSLRLSTVSSWYVDTNGAQSQQTFIALAGDCRLPHVSGTVSLPQSASETCNPHWLIQTLATTRNMWFLGYCFSDYVSPISFMYTDCKFGATVWISSSWHRFRGVPHRFSILHAKSISSKSEVRGKMFPLPTWWSILNHWNSWTIKSSTMHQEETFKNETG